MSAQEQHLFEKRIPIYPRSVKGRFRNLKWGILLLAYGVYFLLPWLRWTRDSGPAQAVLFDIEARRFYLFDLVVHAQDIFWLAGFLVIAALLLFFVTGILGRAFCGYFCFQTLWTDVFLLIERMVQGERPARIRLDKGPWSIERLWKKGTTHLLWLLVAFVTGYTFVLYWGDAPQLQHDFYTGTAPFPAYATALFLTLTTYVMAGLAREQVCTYMCPYARFQSVMFDRNTRIVAYDVARGEGGAGRRKLGAGFKTREERKEKDVGDCIDCGFCVQVCPTGIDIRNGLQIQCITCALCIDACDNIMDSLGWPRGLVSYTSDNLLEGKPSHYFTVKNVGYALAIVAAVTLLAYSILERAPLEMAVEQVRQPLYVVLSDGGVQNSYEIKLNNKTGQVQRVHLAMRGLPGALLDLGQIDTDITLEPEQSLRVQARVRQPTGMIRAAQQHFEFHIQPHDARLASLKQSALFSAPGHQ